MDTEDARRDYGEERDEGKQEKAVVRQVLDLPHQALAPGQAADLPHQEEERRLAVGKIEGRLCVVAYTVRGQIIRLISARKANEREWRKYVETLSA